MHLRDTARYGTGWYMCVQKSPPSCIKQCRQHLHNHFTKIHLSMILPSLPTADPPRGLRPKVCRIYYLLLPLLCSHHPNWFDRPNTTTRRQANYKPPHHVIFCLPTYTFLIQTGRRNRLNSLTEIFYVDYNAFIKRANCIPTCLIILQKVVAASGNNFDLHGRGCRACVNSALRIYRTVWNHTFSSVLRLTSFLSCNLILLSHEVNRIRHTKCPPSPRCRSVLTFYSTKACHQSPVSIFPVTLIHLVTSRTNAYFCSRTYQLHGTSLVPI